MSSRVTRIGLSSNWEYLFGPVTEANDDDAFLANWDRSDAVSARLKRVDPYEKLRIAFIGQGADGDDGTVRISGFVDDGPGFLLGEVTLDLGPLTVDFGVDHPKAVMKSFETQAKFFDATQTPEWKMTKAITVASNYDGAMSVLTHTGNQAHLILDLTKGMWTHLYIETQLPAVTPIDKLMGIFIPIQ